MRENFKIAVLGDVAVGKSALIHRLVSAVFHENYEPTIEERYEKSLACDGGSIHLEILDSSGKELVAEMLDRYIRNADGFVVVYSVASGRSLERAIRIFERIALLRGTHSIPRVLVGAKLDSERREVSLETGQSLSAQLQCSFAETSAKHGINVTEVFDELVQQMRFIGGLRKKARWEDSPTRSFCCFL